MIYQKADYVTKLHLSTAAIMKMCYLKIWVGFQNHVNINYVFVHYLSYYKILYIVKIPLL